MKRISFLLGIVFLPKAVFSKSPIQPINKHSGLYYCHHKSLLGAFQEFLIIKDSIAIFECLAERGGVIFNAEITDTSILVDETAFVGKRYRITFLDDVFVLSDQKSGKRVSKFVKASDGNIKQWHSKHNRMSLDSFYENSKAKRTYTQSKVDTAINWILLFDDLSKKCLKLDRESFKKEIEIFGEKYFYNY